MTSVSGILKLCPYVEYLSKYLFKIEKFFNFLNRYHAELIYLTPQNFMVIFYRYLDDFNLLLNQN